MSDEWRRVELSLSFSAPSSRVPFRASIARDSPGIVQFKKLTSVIVSSFFFFQKDKSSLVLK